MRIAANTYLVWLEIDSFCDVWSSSNVSMYLNNGREFFINFAYARAHLHETFFTRHVINTFTVRISPIYVIELLFFAIFGQTTHEQLKEESYQPDWTKVFFKLAFGIYMLVSVVVLINLLIAMMSDTYQRIQAQSDIEWKYGLSKLVRNMHR